MEQLVVATGLKSYEIADEHGNIKGVISINPTDINIFTRATEVENKIDDALATMRTMNENQSEERLMYLDAELKNAINYLFQSDDVSEIVFGKQNVLNTLNGVTFIERFMNAIMPVITKEVKREVSEIDSHIAKYTEHLEK